MQNMTVCTEAGKDVIIFYSTVFLLVIVLRSANCRREGKGHRPGTRDCILMALMACLSDKEVYNCMF